MNCVSDFSQHCSFDRESYTCTSIPDQFICPLTLNIMRDPVMIRTGHTFERSAIFKWLEKGHDTCPLTRQPLGISGLVTNHALLVEMQKWRALQRHPSSNETDDETDSCISTRRWFGISGWFDSQYGSASRRHSFCSNRNNSERVSRSLNKSKTPLNEVLANEKKYVVFNICINSMIHYRLTLVY